MDIYEINFDNEIPFSEKIDLIKQLGDFSVFNNFFYLNTEKTELEIMEVLKKIKSIKEIDSQNYKNISNNFCQEWCHSIFVKNELSKFEKEHQDSLKDIDTQLDFLIDLQEKGELENYMKGGSFIGKEKRENTD